MLDSGSSSSSSLSDSLDRFEGVTLSLSAGGSDRVDFLVPSGAFAPSVELGFSVKAEYLRVTPREESLGGDEMMGCFARAKKASSLRWELSSGVESRLVFPRLDEPWDRVAGVGGGTGAERAGQSSSFASKGRWGDLEMSAALRDCLVVDVMDAGMMALLVEFMIGIG